MAEAHKTNLFERTIAAISPSWALRRFADERKLTQFGWDGANPGTLRGNSGGLYRNGSPETPMMNRDRLQLMWEARDLERNAPIITGVLDRVAQYTCHRLDYKSNTGDSKIDQEYEKHFREWSKRADLTGRLSLSGMCQLAVRSLFRDGDMGFIMLKRNGELRLQAVEADRIGSPMNHNTTNQDIGGMLIGDDGRVTGVEIFRRTVQNQYEKDHDEKAENFIHFFKPTRFDQYRGVSALGPVIPHARDAYELIALEKSACKYQSSYAGFLKMQDVNADDSSVGWSQAPESSPNKPANVEAASGKIQRLSAGEEIVFAPGSQRPSGAFMQFHEVLIRLIALGLNFPYGFVWNMAEFGGTSARVEVKQAERRIQELQALLVEIVLERVRDQVLALAIANKVVPAHPNWKGGKFTFGAWLTADVGYQTNSDLQLVAAGLKSRHQYGQENDCDFEETQTQIFGEIEFQRDLSKKTLIPIELTPGGNPQASMFLAAMAQNNKTLDQLEQEQAQSAPAQPQPVPGLIGSVGEKGVKLLLTINDQVGKGIMDREEAIQQVSAIYGISIDEASALVSSPTLKTTQNP